MLLLQCVSSNKSVSRLLVMQCTVVQLSLPTDVGLNKAPSLAGTVSPSIADNYLAGANALTMPSVTVSSCSLYTANF